MAREPLKQQTRLDFRFGSKANIAKCEANVRFTPESGHRRVPPQWPLSASFDKSAVQRKDAHTPGSLHHWGTPTVDIDRCPGDVATLLRRQQAGEIGKFLRLAGATERNLLAVRVVVLLERHVGPLRPLHMLVGANDADEHGIH